MCSPPMDAHPVAAFAVAFVRMSSVTTAGSESGYLISTAQVREFCVIVTPVTSGIANAVAAKAKAETVSTNVFAFMVFPSP